MRLNATDSRNIFTSEGDKINLARYRDSRDSSRLSASLIVALLDLLRLAECSTVRYMWNPLACDVLDYTAVQSIEKAEKREKERAYIAGERTKSWERERVIAGGRERREKNGSTAKSVREARVRTKARFDGVVVPRLLNLFETRILVDKPPYTQPPHRPPGLC